MKRDLKKTYQPPVAIATSFGREDVIRTSSTFKEDQKDYVSNVDPNWEGVWEGGNAE